MHCDKYTDLFYKDHQVLCIVTIRNRKHSPRVVFQTYLLITLSRFGILKGVLNGVVPIDSVHPFRTERERDVLRLYVG